MTTAVQDAAVLIRDQITSHHLAPLFAWGAAGVVAMMLRAADPTVGADYSQIATAVVTLAFGVWAFWVHGGPQITTAGLYCLSVAVFVGYAGLWWSAQPGATSPLIVTATLTGWWTTYAMYVLCWSRPRHYARLRVSSPEVTHWGVWMGLAAAAAGTALGAIGYGSLVQFSVGALSLLTVALMLHRAQGQRAVGRLILAGGIVAVFWQTSFSGYGRLNLVALGLVALVLASARTGRRTVKALVLGAAVPALWVFVRIREQLGVELYGRELDGLGSVVNPLGTFGRLVDGHSLGTYSFEHGSTFLATATFWVPGQWWSGKPDGFGAELVALLYPELVNTNHSVAAHAYGEWYFNFGWLGVVAMVPVIGWFVWWLDRLLGRTVARPVDSRRRLMVLVAILVAVAAIPTLMWVGSFTYAARVGQQLLILAVIALPFASRRQNNE